MRFEGMRSKKNSEDIKKTVERERLASSFDEDKYSEYTGEEIRLDIDPWDDDREARRERRIKHASVLIVLISLAICMALTVAALSSSYTIPDAEDKPANEEQKVIYIKDDDGSTLTAPEIYTKGLPSTVTVIAKDTGASGSGFVYSKDGYIATAAHVIADSDDVEVVMSDGRRFEGFVVGNNELSDIALIKIECEGLVEVEIGESGDLIVGEEVFVIGSPSSEKYAGSFSRGEISYVNRTVDVFNTLDDELEKRLTVLQTNAALSEGNSGSPMFDQNGRLIGMVTMKLGGKNEGVGFAIPSDGLCTVLRAMKEGRRLNDSILSSVAVKAPTLGIEGQSVFIDGVYGYEIKSFVDSASDSRRTLRVGDIIVSIGSDAVYNRETALDAICKHSPKDKVTVGVIRNAQRLSFDVTLG